MHQRFEDCLRTTEKISSDSLTLACARGSQQCPVFVAAVSQIPDSPQTVLRHTLAVECPENGYKHCGVDVAMIEHSRTIRALETE